MNARPLYLLNAYDSLKFLNRQSFFFLLIAIFLHMILLFTCILFLFIDTFWNKSPLSQIDRVVVWNTPKLEYFPLDLIGGFLEMILGVPSHRLVVLAMFVHHARDPPNLLPAESKILFLRLVFQRFLLQAFYHVRFSNFTCPTIGISLHASYFGNNVLLGRFDWHSRVGVKSDTQLLHVLFDGLCFVPIVPELLTANLHIVLAILFLLLLHSLLVDSVVKLLLPPLFPKLCHGESENSCRSESSNIS